MLVDIDYSPFQKSDTVVLALSGGADSTFLLESLFAQGFSQLVVAHFNHSLRGIESDEDECWCRDKAKEKKYLFESEKWTSPKKDEQSCRNARYDFLERIRRKYNAKAIITGHHQDDQSETIFLQWMRGGGGRALSGMKKWDDQRKIFRPLLSLSKNSIVKTLNNTNVCFREESLNTDEKYTRNFLRLRIFPELKKRFTDFDVRIALQSSLFQKEWEFLSQEAKNWISQYAKDPINMGVNKERFLLLRPFLQYEVLRELIDFSLSSAQFEYVIEFLMSGESGKTYQQKTFSITLSQDLFFIDRA